MNEKTGVVGTQIGGIMAVFGGLTLNEWLAVGGFFLALISFIFQAWISWYYKERHYRLALAKLKEDERNEVMQSDAD